MDVAILPSAKVFWIRAAVHTEGGAEEQYSTKPNSVAQQCLLAHKLGAFGKKLSIKFCETISP